ncbi:MAG: zinc metallopeptidase [Spirochaetales bacterium]|nr:zinc metallopeptidase [Spirochaetales bacterium]
MLTYLFAYWWLFIPGILLSILAQVAVSTTYSRYRKIRAASGLTGGEAARKILDANGLTNVRIEGVEGRLSDHYDPRTGVLRLSNETLRGHSLASLGVAAHEVGHALQHHQKYLPLTVHINFVPTVRITSTLAPFFIIGGLIFGTVQSLLWIGIILYSFAVVYSLVSLPIELNASKRAVHALSTSMMLKRSELPGVKSILTAAAFTYVAAAITSILHLIRLVLISRARR